MVKTGVCASSESRLHEVWEMRGKVSQHMRTLIVSKGQGLSATKGLEISTKNWEWMEGWSH
jgi:hypothetical protein